MLIFMVEDRLLRLPESLRPLLQQPLGRLFSSFSEVVEHLRKIKPARLVTVGDTVTSSFLHAGIKPDVAIVDLKAMRSPIDEKTRSLIDSFSGSVVRVKNPAATITPELWAAIKAAKPPVKIVVEGEEDLATIPAVISSPDGAVVVYGQPRAGLVLVEVDEKKRQEMRDILSKFVG